MAVLLFALTLAIASFISIAYRYYALRARLPPGPRGLPIIGNLPELPADSDYPWRHYRAMHQKYGPIFSLQAGATTLIFLGSHSVAKELLEQRSSIYSSRPHQPMISDLLTKGDHTLFQPYGPKWRVYRRMHNQVLNRQICASYQAAQDLESRQLLQELLSHGDFTKGFARYAASLVFTLAYGQRIHSSQQPEARELAGLMQELNQFFLTRWSIDLLPFLTYLPKIISPWKQIADTLGDRELKFFTDLREAAVHREGWNWTKVITESEQGRQLTSRQLSYLLGNLYEAGADTTAGVLQSFVLAAVLHPKVMKKAQEQIDSVVGSARLPEFDDLARLPLVHAIANEVIRWRPIVPGGVPHAPTQDDTYKGYHIPKGAVIFPSIWSISMNADVYENPEDFDPERWIRDPDLPLASFGYGRRKCVGIHMAQNSVLIIVARLLWAFDIGHAYEDGGAGKVKVEVDPYAYVSEFNSPPKPFRASFTPRIKGIEALLGRGD